jgi:hypothetical protein
MLIVMKVPVCEGGSRCGVRSCSRGRHGVEFCKNNLASYYGFFSAANYPPCCCTDPHLVDAGWKNKEVTFVTPDLVGCLGDGLCGLHVSCKKLRLESSFEISLLQDISLCSFSSSCPFLRRLLFESSDNWKPPKMNPGTALAIVGLCLDAVKDLHSYYVVWKDRDRDVEEVGQQLIWLMNLFQTIQVTLKQDDLNPAQV